MFGLHHINRIKYWTVQGILLIIRGYQMIVSPLLGSVCRFYPSCSHYAMEAIDRYGLKKGLRLAFGRLLRCHPWNPGGFDPVP